MIPPLIRASLAALAMASTLPFAYAQAPLCPTPDLFDTTTPTAISPKKPADNDEVLYWIAGPGFYELESYTVDRQGFTINLTTREVVAPFFAGEPSRCRTISLGVLPPGKYTIVRTSYFRDITQPSYPALPALDRIALPSFNVSATSAVPATNAYWLFALSTLLITATALRFNRSQK